VPYDLDFYEKKKISEIDPGSDSKVKVIGMVLEKQDDTMVIDDGTGKITSFGASNPDIEVNGIVRVFGIVLPGETGFELKADIVQNLTGLDLNLYKSIDELILKKGV
jgi:hypothetical protein